MGANAQTTVQKFVDGAVLTAAQQNTSAATGVPVFATTVTRDAAFGGANKVLAEGQTCYLESTNVVQYYDGAAWATVGPAAAGGLVVVQAETAFTAQANLTVDNIFTSAYSNYRIVYTATAAAGASSSLQLRVGGVAAASAYNRQDFVANGTFVGASQVSAQASFQYAVARVAAMTVILEIFNPRLASTTLFYSNAIDNDNSASTMLGQMYWGNQTTATAYDGIALTFGSNSTGTYTIYGYGKTL